MFNFFDSFQQQQQHTSKHKELYETLDVPQSASQSDIKKQYRKKAMKHHPDKGGCVEKFKEITRAYEVLSDPGTRKRYDMFGDESSGNTNNMNDIFQSMFSHGNGFGTHRNNQTSPPVRVVIQVSLDDVYHGRGQTVTFNRECKCTSCNGRGGVGVKSCKTCNGKGVTVRLHQIGPGMIKQIQSTCTDCDGIGTRADVLCTVCIGKSRTIRESSLQIQLPKHIGDGVSISCKGKGHDPGRAVGSVPGDVIITIRVKEHNTFTRKGPDLHMKQNITLLESLCGYQFIVSHLDGGTINIKSEPGKITPSGTVRRIKEKGMLTSGSLVITFHVIFPLKIDIVHHNTLSTILTEK
jgi:DnaJ family protein A protein 2